VDLFLCNFVKKYEYLLTIKKKFLNKLFIFSICIENILIILLIATIMCKFIFILIISYKFQLYIYIQKVTLSLQLHDISRISINNVIN